MKRMTLDQIKKKYPNEWVLIADPEEDELLEVKSGKVIVHSTKRETIYTALKERHGNFAIRYTGKIKGKTFVL